MKNTTIKNGVTGVLVNISIPDVKGRPVLVPTQFSVVCDKGFVDLDASGVKNWIQSFQEKAEGENKVFDAEGFLDEFFKEHSLHYAKLTMMYGYFAGDTYPITRSIEQIDSKSIEKLSVAYFNQSAGVTIDAQAHYMNRPTIDEVVKYLNKASQEIKSKHWNMHQVASELKDQLNHEFGLYSYSIVVRKYNNICVIEG